MFPHPIISTDTVPEWEGLDKNWDQTFPKGCSAYRSSARGWGKSSVPGLGRVTSPPGLGGAPGPAHPMNSRDERRPVQGTRAALSRVPPQIYSKLGTASSAGIYGIDTKSQALPHPFFLHFDGLDSLFQTLFLPALRGFSRILARTSSRLGAPQDLILIYLYELRCPKQLWDFHVWDWMRFKVLRNPNQSGNVNKPTFTPISAQRCWFQEKKYPINPNFSCSGVNSRRKKKNSN